MSQHRQGSKSDPYSTARIQRERKYSILTINNHSLGYILALEMIPIHYSTLMKAAQDVASQRYIKNRWSQLTRKSSTLSNCLT